MKILYLSEDYIGTEVHHNLCNEILKTHTKVVDSIQIYCLTRASNASFDKSDKYGERLYNVCLNKFIGSESLYKYNFWYKKRKKLADIENSIDINQFDLIHATLLFSEGVIAYELSKKYHIPYTISVRGTDVSVYVKYMFHLWPLGRKILLSASKVIFVAEHIKKSVLNSNFALLIRNELEIKSQVISNAIDDYWLNHIYSKKKIKKAANVVYIGRFDKNKNTERLMDAISLIKSEGRDVHLTLIGGGAERHKYVMQKCNSDTETFNYLGPIYDRDVLSRVLRQSDVFAMVSHSETFGLVYLEAMSQGLPLLYSKNQGVDGMFNGKIGEVVNSYDVNDIKNGLLLILDNYQDYYTIGNDLAKFSWKNIASSYLNIYSEI